MMDMIMHIFFFIFILPYLILRDGLEKLNKKLAENNMAQVEGLHLTLILLLFILIILVSLGYRW